MFGGGKEGQKIAEYVLAIRRGQYDAELDITPTDKNKGQKPAAKKPKSVKSSRKRRTVQRSRKIRAKKAAKPLKEKEMEPETEEQSSPDESGAVKPDKASLEESSEDGPAVAEAMAGKLELGNEKEEEERQNSPGSNPV